jgi:hypothetical protein
LEEHIASIIRVTRICALGTKLAVTSNRRTMRRNTTSLLQLLVTASIPSSHASSCHLIMDAIRSSEAAVHVPKDRILHCYRREHIISYMVKICSKTTGIELWVWEHDTSQNDKSRFYAVYQSLFPEQLVHNISSCYYTFVNSPIEIATA